MAAGTDRGIKNVSQQCGAASGGFLDSWNHPTLGPYQTLSMGACFDGSLLDCSQSSQYTTVDITNCGGYYVYKLPEAPANNSRYCGAGEKDTTSSTSGLPIRVSQM